MGHKISKEQIDPGVKDHIMSFVGDIADLETEVNTDIISAVNSLMVDRVDNAENMGKLANAIGEPVTANHSVDEVVEGLGEMLSTFKTNMMNSGVVVESSDKFKQLIDKIKGLTEGEGNKGIQFAMGDVNSGFGGYGDTTLSQRVTMNLDFNPTYIFCELDAFLYTSENSYDILGKFFYISNIDPTVYLRGLGYNRFMTDISSEGFTISHSNINSENQYNHTYIYKWYAIGVGEDDTTLRDSLASILEEEGVSVTEEDDMASLISKVDSEFAKDNNTINDLNTDIENTRSTLAGLMQEGGYDITGDEDIDRLLDLLVLSGISVSEIKQIVGSDSFTFILKYDGSVWSCGGNTWGQLGLNNTNNKHTFTKVTTNINNDVKQIACGIGHTFILKNDGSVWSCGYNEYGQLGLGDTTTYKTFTQVTTNINSDVKHIVCGSNYTFILKNDGSVWSCGNNAYGQLGLNDTDNRTVFTQITTNINNDVKQIACSSISIHTFILKNDGSIWSCGINEEGQLGLGTSDTNAHSTFTQVTTNINNDVKQVACGEYHTFILKNDGSVWSCGNNEDGQLGLGNTTKRKSFTQVTTNINNDVKQIVCGSHHTFILKNDGSVWGCGSNYHGELGLDDTTDRTSFTQVTTNINNDVKQIVCGGEYTFILKNDGSVYSCGYNGVGQLGLNNTTSKSIFTMIPRGLY